MGRHPSRRHSSPDEAPVGRRIRQRRRQLGLTQADLAGPEYTKSFISQLESGYADPSLDTLRFLGRRLRLGLSSMAGDDADQRLALLDGLLAWAREAALTWNGAGARRAVEMALEIAQGAGTDLHATDALLLQADLDLADGRVERAEAAVRAVGEMAGGLDARVQARAALAGGRLDLYRRETTSAVRSFRQVLAQTRRAARYPDLAVEALLGLATAALAAGDRRQARRRLESAVRAAERGGLAGLHATALLRLAVLLRLEGAPDEALGHLRSAGRILGEAGDHRARIHRRVVLGHLLREGGAADDAVAVLRDALALARESTHPPGTLEALLALGRAALAAGDVGLADETAAEADRLAEALAEPAAQARAAALRGRAMLAGGAADAVAVLTGAVARLEGSPASDELAEAAAALAAHHASTDREAAARCQAISEEAGRRFAAARAWPVDLLAGR